MPSLGCCHELPLHVFIGFRRDAPRRLVDKAQSLEQLGHSVRRVDRLDGPLHEAARRFRRNIQTGVEFSRQRHKLFGVERWLAALLVQPFDPRGTQDLTQSAVFVDRLGINERNRCNPLRRPTSAQQ
jgi:hypothetical protein